MSWEKRLIVVCSGLLAANALGGTVRVWDLNFGVNVNTLVGRQGSVAGPLPFVSGASGIPVTAAGGIFGDSLGSTVGPVPPGQIVSLPGTSAVATAQASTFTTITPAGATTTLQTAISTNDVVVAMDGGSYLATGGGSFSYTFEVDTPTPYTLTGTLALDTEDPLASLQFVGQFIFLLPSSNGNLSYSGTLAPGTYILRGSTQSSAPFFPINSGNDSDSSSLSLTLTLGATLVNVGCDSIDFNADGLFPDTADIDDFLSVFSGGACSTGTCHDIDFNNDGLFPDTTDIDALLSVFSGGPCV